MDRAVPRSRLRPGDSIVVRKSWSSDVPPGVRGTVVDAMPGGYAVNITSLFSDAFGRRAVETRCLFFRFREIQRVKSVGLPTDSPKPVEESRA